MTESAPKRWTFFKRQLIGGECREGGPGSPPGSRAVGARSARRRICVLLKTIKNNVFLGFLSTYANNSDFAFFKSMRYPSVFTIVTRCREIPPIYATSIYYRKNRGQTHVGQEIRSPKKCNEKVTETGGPDMQLPSVFTIVNACLLFLLGVFGVPYLGPTCDHPRFLRV